MWGTTPFFFVCSHWKEKKKKSHVSSSKVLSRNLFNSYVRVKTLPAQQETCDIFLAAGCLSKLWTHQSFEALLVLASMLWLTSKLGKKGRCLRRKSNVILLCFHKLFRFCSTFRVLALLNSFTCTAPLRFLCYKTPDTQQTRSPDRAALFFNFVLCGVTVLSPLF